MLHRKSEKVDVGELFRTEDAVSREQARVKQRDVIGPELVTGQFELHAQDGNCFGYRDGPRVTATGNDSQEAVLRQRTTRPSLPTFRNPPRTGTLMMNVGGIEQGDEDIDIEQRAQLLFALAGSRIGKIRLIEQVLNQLTRYDGAGSRQ